MSIMILVESQTFPATLITQNPAITQPERPSNKILKLFKSLTPKQKILAVLAGVVLLSLLLWAILTIVQKANQPSTPQVIAKIDDKNVYSSYLDREMELYPAPKDERTKEILTKKIIDDQITLGGGKADGLIASYPDGEDLPVPQYLERTQKVAEVKEMVTAKENSLEGELVSIWFYNAGFVGPEGYEKSRQSALDKITGLYERVKNKEITIKQAGELIAADTSLAQTDPAYKENAYTLFDIEQGRPITFWRQFDEILRALKPGEITPVYLGDSFSESGGPARDGVYMFGHVTGKIETAGYNSFETWLSAKKKQYQSQIRLPFYSTGLVLADDGNSNSNDDEWGSIYDGACGHGCPPFTGVVLSRTGAPVANVRVTITNRRNQTQQTLTNDLGEYFFSAVGNFNCSSSPMRFSVDFSGSQIINTSFWPFGLVRSVFAQATSSASLSASATASASASVTPSPVAVNCPPVVKPIGNILSVQTVPPIKCEGPLPSPTPTPLCSPLPAETQTLSCPPGHEGTIIQTRTSACPGPKWTDWVSVTNTCTPPPACNDGCTSDAQCERAPDGCTACLPSDTGTASVCRPPAACNTSCTKDSQCAKAVDGCTACVGGACRVPPSCGTACTTKAECSGVKDGCSECLEGTCTNYNDNMCKCDGMVADIVYPSTSFNFEAFGKVNGSDAKKAEIADITFRLTRDNQVVAKSNPITPTVTESSSDKVRFKAAWSTAPPAVVRGATYRVFADVRCKPKKIVASAKENFSPNPNISVQAQQPKPPLGLKLLVDLADKLFDGHNWIGRVIVGDVMAQLASPSPSVQTNIQLQTLNFVKLMDTDNCRFVMFKFDETLF